MRIGINCGHTLSGTIGAGAKSYLDESIETRNVGRKLIEYLKQGGIEVVDCTNDIASTVHSNVENICILANAQKLDGFISIHFNAGKGTGTEIYTYGGKDVVHAKDIKDGLVNLGFVDRGIKDGSRYYVIKHTKAPAALIEICFVDREEDAKLYKELSADVIAKTIAEAILGKTNAELTSINDIVWELHHNGIITNKELWLDKLEQDEDAYWLARKCANYIRR